MCIENSNIDIINGNGSKILSGEALSKDIYETVVNVKKCVSVMFTGTDVYDCTLWHKRFCVQEKYG